MDHIVSGRPQPRQEPAPRRDHHRYCLGKEASHGEQQAQNTSGSSSSSASRGRHRSRKPSRTPPHPGSAACTTPAKAELTGQGKRNRRLLPQRHPTSINKRLGQVYPAYQDFTLEGSAHYQAGRRSSSASSSSNSGETSSNPAAPTSQSTSSSQRPSSLCFQAATHVATHKASTKPPLPFPFTHTARRPSAHSSTPPASANRTKYEFAKRSISRRSPVTFHSNKRGGGGGGGGERGGGESREEPLRGLFRKEKATEATEATKRSLSASRSNIPSSPSASQVASSSTSVLAGPRKRITSSEPSSAERPVSKKARVTPPTASLAPPTWSSSSISTAHSYLHHSIAPRTSFVVLTEPQQGLLLPVYRQKRRAHNLNTSSHAPTAVASTNRASTSSPRNFVTPSSIADLPTTERLFGYRGKRYASTSSVAHSVLSSTPFHPLGGLAGSRASRSLAAVRPNRRRAPTAAAGATCDRAYQSAKERLGSGEIEMMDTGGDCRGEGSSTVATTSGGTADARKARESPGPLSATASSPIERRQLDRWEVLERDARYGTRSREHASQATDVGSAVLPTKGCEKGEGAHESALNKEDRMQIDRSPPFPSLTGQNSKTRESSGERSPKSKDKGKGSRSASRSECQESDPAAGTAPIDSVATGLASSTQQLATPHSLLDLLGSGISSSSSNCGGTGPPDDSSGNSSQAFCAAAATAAMQVLPSGIPTTNPIIEFIYNRVSALLDMIVGKDQSLRLIGLQELAELLSMANEETIFGIIQMSRAMATRRQGAGAASSSAALVASRSKRREAAAASDASKSVPQESSNPRRVVSATSASGVKSSGSQPSGSVLETPLTSTCPSSSSSANTSSRTLSSSSAPAPAGGTADSSRQKPAAPSSSSKPKQRPPGMFETLLKELVATIAGSATGKHSLAAELGLSEEQLVEMGLSEPSSSQDSPELIILACRCLSNLMEANHASARTLVSYGAVKALVAKLQNVEYIDLAETVLRTLEQLSHENALAIVRAGGLHAVLQYLDFFNTNTQRKAMAVTAACCKSLPLSNAGSGRNQYVSHVRSVLPVLVQTLQAHDDVVLERSTYTWLKIVETYQADHKTLESLISDDIVKLMLTTLAACSRHAGSTGSSSSTTGSTSLSTSGSFLSSSQRHTSSSGRGGKPQATLNLLQLFTRVARSSCKLSADMLDHGVVEVLHSMLIAPGHTPNDSSFPSSNASKVTGKDITSTMTCALIAAPKDRLKYILDILMELLPPLQPPLVRSKHILLADSGVTGTRDRANVSNQSNQNPTNSKHSQESGSCFPGDSKTTPATTPPSVRPGSAGLPSVEKRCKERQERLAQRASERKDMLDKRQSTVCRLSKLLLPLLTGLYISSPSLENRRRIITTILELVSWMSGDLHRESLGDVRLPYFLSSVLAQREHSALLIPCLEVVLRLLQESPSLFIEDFEREGTLYEVEAIARREDHGIGSSEPGLNIASLFPSPSATLQPSSEQDANMMSLDSASTNMDIDTQWDPLEQEQRIRRFLCNYEPIEGADLRLSLPGDGPGTGIGCARGVLVYLAARIVLLSREVLASRQPTKQTTEADHVLLIGSNGTCKGHLDILQGLVRQVQAAESGDSLRSWLEMIRDDYIASARSLTGFELLQSKLLDGLHDLLTSSNHAISKAKRRVIFHQVFRSNSRAAKHLLRMLHDLLAKSENFKVSLSSDVSNSASRRFGLRLEARKDTSFDDIPESCKNFNVSVYGLTRIENIEEFLRKKILSRKNGGSSRTGLSSSACRHSTTAAVASLLSSLNLAQSTLKGMKSKQGSDQGVADASNEPSKAKPTPGQGTDTEEGSQGSQSSEGEARAYERTQSSDGEDGRNALKLDDADIDSHDTAEEFDDMDDDDDRLSDEDGDDHGLDHPDDHDEDDEDDDEDQYEDEDISYSLSTGDRLVGLSEGMNTRSDMADLSNPGQEVYGSGVSSSSRPVGSSAEASTSSNPGKSSSSDPEDCHVSISMNGRTLMSDSTVFASILRGRKGRTTDGRRAHPAIHSATHMNFELIQGKKPTPFQQQQGEASSPLGDYLPAPDSVADSTTCLKTLQLLEAIHESLNQDSYFLNAKLDAKVNRQLDDPLIVASSCLPDWTFWVIRRFPFLFSFEARQRFLQYTSYGTLRAVQRWLADHPREYPGAQLHQFNRLRKQRVRICRLGLLESTRKVMRMFSGSRSVLEIEYKDEVGFGLGPTLEYYTLVSREFGRRSLNIWRDDRSHAGDYVYYPGGLFPCPRGTTVDLSMFEVLGTFVARALLDSRVLDLQFHPIFLKRLISEDWHPTLDELAGVDPQLASSLKQLLSMESAEMVDSLCLHFTLPGHDQVQLVPGGSERPVVIENVHEYVDAVLDHTIGTRGILDQVNSFRKGHQQVFPLSDLAIFTVDELSMILCGRQDEDWSFRTLHESIKADHGYHSNSAALSMFIEILTEYTAQERRLFLSFVTGAAKLPIGGFRRLNPRFTVVRKNPEGSASPDDYLPSVMTCVNYLKLPAYSTKEVMRARVHTAMTEGQGSFHLS